MLGVQSYFDEQRLTKQQLVVTHLDNAIYFIADRSDLLQARNFKNLIHVSTASVDSFFRSSLDIDPMELLYQIENTSTSKVVLKVAREGRLLSWLMSDLD